MNIAVKNETQDVPGVHYSLLDPVTDSKGERVADIFIRRPVGGDMRYMPLPGDDDETVKKIEFFSALTGLGLSVLDEMLGDDFDEIDQIVGDMMLEGAKIALGPDGKPASNMHKLLYPVDDLKEITIRRPRAKDYKIRPNNPTGPGDTYRYLATLAGLEEQQIDDLDAADIVAITAIVEATSEKKKRTRRS